MSRRKSSPRSSKRKKSASARRRLFKTLTATVLVLLFFFFGAVAAWLGYATGQEEAKRECGKQIARYRDDVERLREKLDRLKEVSFNRRERTQKPKLPPPPPPQTRHQQPSEIRDYVKAGGQAHRAEPSKGREKLRTDRPKLVIIIDDVAYPWQIAAIRRLGIAVTPSLFPPTPSHPKTPQMAGKLNHYMVHLPMEARAFARPELETLRTVDSKEVIARKLSQIRRLFPKAKFMNNHTGSKFTADSAAMDRFCALASRLGFVFVDSRTTPASKVRRMCKKYGMPYLARDIFLDNEADRGYILGQLKKAVRIAKAHGYAIAIGHPRPATFKALAAAGDILKEVDVVYLDELYKKIR